MSDTRARICRGPPSAAVPVGRGAAVAVGRRPGDRAANPPAGRLHHGQGRGPVPPPPALGLAAHRRGHPRRRRVVGPPERRAGDAHQREAELTTILDADVEALRVWMAEQGAQRRADRRRRTAPAAGPGTARPGRQRPGGRAGPPSGEGPGRPPRPARPAAQGRVHRVLRGVPGRGGPGRRPGRAVGKPLAGYRREFFDQVLHGRPVGVQAVPTVLLLQDRRRASCGPTCRRCSPPPRSGTRPARPSPPWACASARKTSSRASSGGPGRRDGRDLRLRPRRADARPEPLRRRPEADRPAGRPAGRRSRS